MIARTFALLLFALPLHAAELYTMLVDSNGVQRVPAALTLTNVTIQGFTLDDLDDIDISDRADGKVLSWSDASTNHVYVAQGGHDAVSLSANSIGSISNQVLTVSTNDVVDALIKQSVILNDLTVGDPNDGIFVDNSNIVLAGSTNLYFLTWSTPGQLDLSGNLSVAGAISGDGSGLTNLAYTIESAADVDASSRSPGDVLTWDGTNHVYAAVAPIITTNSFMSSSWVGPKASEGPGWAIKDYALTGFTGVVEGLRNGTATQKPATVTSNFLLPSLTTGWAATNAVTVAVIGDSTSSAQVKLDLKLYEAGTATAIASKVNQVLTSTTAPTVFSFSSSDISSFDASKIYSIVVTANVTTNALYFIGQPRIQVKQ